MDMKLFTPRSARRLLDRIRASAETMSRLFRVLELARPRGDASDRLVDPDYYRMVRMFLATLATIEDAGVRVKDARSGLLDFPARRAGRTVLLCWRIGEPTIAYWHEEATGVAGRQALDEDGPWEGRDAAVDEPA